MRRYEYTVIAAPLQGVRAPQARTPADRFATALGTVLNEMAVQGWEYVRAETLPSEERSGLAGRKTAWHNLLVFRRCIGGRIGPDSKAGPSGDATGPALPD